MQSSFTMNPQILAPKNNNETFLEEFQYQGFIELLLRAVMQENEEDIRSIISESPDCFDMTIFQQRFLHLSLENNKLLAFRVLVEELKNHNLHHLLNLKDQRGDTVLHIATANKLLEIVELLLADTATNMSVNCLNNKGHTALDIDSSLEHDAITQQIRHFLLEAGAQHSHPPHPKPPATLVTLGSPKTKNVLTLVAILVLVVGAILSAAADPRILIITINGKVVISSTVMGRLLTWLILVAALTAKFVVHLCAIVMLDCMVSFLRSTSSVLVAEICCGVTAAAMVFVFFSRGGSSLRELPPT